MLAYLAGVLSVYPPDVHVYLPGVPAVYPPGVMHEYLPGVPAVCPAGVMSCTYQVYQLYAQQVLCCVPTRCTSCMPNRCYVSVPTRCTSLILTRFLMPMTCSGVGVLAQLFRLQPEWRSDEIKQTLHWSPVGCAITCNSPATSCVALVVFFHVTRL